MSRPLAFKQADSTRALKGAKAAGVSVSITVSIDRRTITVAPVGSLPTSPLDDWKRNRDAR